MSRDKGNRAAGWVAAYLRSWFPLAEKTPNGRPGADIENTPGVAFEVKTGVVWRDAWLGQVSKYEGLSILVYLGPGIGERNVMHAQTITPLHVMMQLLSEAGYVQDLEEQTRDDQYAWPTLGGGEELCGT